MAKKRKPSKSKAKKHGKTYSKAHSNKKARPRGVAKTKSRRKIPRSHARAETAARNLDQEIRTRRQKNRRYHSGAVPRKKAVGTGYRFTVISARNGKSVSVNKRVTKLKSSEAIKLSRSKSSKDKILSKFLPIAKKHYKSIGKSKGNLYYIKLNYTFSLDKKKRSSSFSIGVTDIRNEDDLEYFISKAVSEFEDRLQSYLSAGFSKIAIDGISVQGYE